MGGATGNDLNIQAVGSVVMKTDQNFTIFLSKCYFSPDLIGNFLSISKLNDIGILVNFSQTSCLLYRGGVLVGDGPRLNDMYAIRAYPMLEATAWPATTRCSHAHSWGTVKII